MDAARFDARLRSLTKPRPRRGALPSLAGGAVAGLAVLHSAKAVADCQARQGRC